MAPAAPLRWLGTLLALLRSSKLTLVVLALYIALLSAALAVPQRSHSDPATVEAWLADHEIVAPLVRLLDLDDLQHAWFFHATQSLLLLNLLLCMAWRLAPVARSLRLPRTAPLAAGFIARREIAARAALSPQQVARLVADRGYATRTFDTAVYGLRGRWALIGHWVLHLGLVLLLVAGELIALGVGPFRGRLGLGEGESFSLHDAQYLGSRGTLPDNVPQLAFRLEKIEIEAVRYTVKSFRARLLLAGGGRAQMGVNDPLRRGPLQIVPQGMGWMPGWVVTGRRGRVLAGGWVKLRPLPSKTIDAFPIDQQGGKVELHFHSDHRRSKTERAAGLDVVLGEPRFDVRITRGEKLLFEGRLAPGQRVALEPDRWFFFAEEIRRYVLVDVMHEGGYPVIFAAFGLIIVGLLIRYGRLRRELLLTYDGDGLRLHWRSRLLSGLHAEQMAQLALALEQAAAGRETGRAETGADR